MAKHSKYVWCEWSKEPIGFQIMVNTNGQFSAKVPEFIDHEQPMVADMTLAGLRGKLDQIAKEYTKQTLVKYKCVYLKAETTLNGEPPSHDVPHVSFAEGYALDVAACVVQVTMTDKHKASVVYLESSLPGGVKPNRGDLERALDGHPFRHGLFKREGIILLPWSEETEAKILSLLTGVERIVRFIRELTPETVTQIDGPGFLLASSEEGGEAS